MELSDDLKDVISDAHTKARGTWVFWSKAMLTGATIEESNGVVRAPEEIVVLELTTVENNADGIQKPEHQTLVLLWGNFVQLAEAVGQVLLTQEMPQLAEVHNWTKDTRKN